MNGIRYVKVSRSPVGTGLDAVERVLEGGRCDAVAAAARTLQPQQKSPFTSCRCWCLSIIANTLEVVCDGSRFGLEDRKPRYDFRWGNKAVGKNILTAEGNHNVERPSSDYSALALAKEPKGSGDHLRMMHV